MKGVMQPPWQSDYSSKHVCGSLFAAQWVFLTGIYKGEICCAGRQVFSEALLHARIYLYLEAALLNSSLVQQSSKGATVERRLYFIFRWFCNFLELCEADNQTELLLFFI